VTEEPSTILQLESVSRVYGSGDAKICALNNASVNIVSGEFLAVVGDSGSGKSTFLNILGGMDRPSSGKVIFNGMDLAVQKDKTLTQYRRNTVAFIFQFYNLIPTLTALENVTVAKDISSCPLDPESVLEDVGMIKLQNHFPSQLSGGQQQRVAIARALVANTPILLCDEPTGALDSRSSIEVMSLIRRIQTESNKTIIFVTHNTAVAQYCSRLMRIIDGGVELVDKD